jgi:hypothetical protein
MMMGVGMVVGIEQESKTNRERELIGNHTPAGKGAPLTFEGICVTMPSTRGSGFKNRNFGVFVPGNETPKTIFWLR